ncbi:glycosyl hydrolase [Aspergillus californicus]
MSSNPESRWRPSFHLLAPHGWLNDPCGPGYDPSAGKYHLAFQWNPKDNDWGDISWGRATSSDLVFWEVEEQPCLVPATPYDCKGIFTGCFQPTNLDGQQDGTLAYFYTAVKSLPIHFTIPYTAGCETLSIALSHDAGLTWERYPNNPILAGPPADVAVTGWRDPYIFSWPSAPPRIKKDLVYGLISGGLVGHTPTVFVYAIEPNALAEWSYIGILLDVGLWFTPSRWSGDFGVNWEVTNLVTLTDEQGISRDFLIMGTEGCNPDANPNRSSNGQLIARSRRIQRSQLWMCIKENSRLPPSTGSSALMQYAFGGILDNGLFYAANSFWDPVAQNQVLFGWITEEDLPDNIRRAQGWSGLISLPRVLKLQPHYQVKRARSTASLSDITSIEATPDGFGTYTVRTLGVLLDPRTQKLRHTARSSILRDVLLGSTQLSENAFVPLTTTRWELEAEIAVGRHCREVGLVIYHDPDKQYKTSLFWDPVEEIIQVNRPDIYHATKTCIDSNMINHAAEITPHTLFTYSSQPRNIQHERKPSNTLASALTSTETTTETESETETEEPLRIHALYDTSVLEIFINDRTTISTRIYHVSQNGNSTCAGLQFYAEPLDVDTPLRGQVDDTPARLVSARIWDGLACSLKSR